MARGYRALELKGWWFASRERQRRDGEGQCLGALGDYLPLKAVGSLRTVLTAIEAQGYSFGSKRLVVSGRIGRGSMTDRRKSRQRTRIHPKPHQ